MKIIDYMNEKAEQAGPAAFPTICAIIWWAVFFTLWHRLHGLLLLKIIAIMAVMSTFASMSNGKRVTKRLSMANMPPKRLSMHAEQQRKPVAPRLLHRRISDGQRNQRIATGINGGWRNITISLTIARTRGSSRP